MSRIFKADSIEITLLLSIAIISCGSFAFYQVYSLLDEYYSYSKVTQIQERRITRDNLDTFPKIRVCNINPTGMLRGFPNNETYVYRDLVLNKTSCVQCAKEERQIACELRPRMDT